MTSKLRTIKIMPWLLFLLISHISYLVSPALADIIYLKTGSSIEGKIISQDKKQVQVQTKSVTITLKTSEILEIIKEDYAPPVEVEIEDSLKISPTSPVITPTLPISPTIAVKPSPISKTATPLVLSDEDKTDDQKEINRLIRKITNLKEGEEYAPLADTLVAKGKDNADYLMELLSTVHHPVALK
ncbi:MAG: hypothetical protein HY762_02470 [Planctomycetes bacterium]|nr:hypothetical protein [Planctomycetota bacterium]